ncbi:hypothetical protein ACH5RR_025821 [Cinchona calisaya]|uniref:Uncharacterized protein n=1 Tax=Cinchona calisaya TaxID=153742 RepID=A0ABD2Z0R5_9GENT
MNSGSFLSLKDDQAYEFLENLSVNSQQWDFSSHRDKPSRKSGLYEIGEDSSMKMMNGVIEISFGNIKAKLNIFDISREPSDLDNVNEVNLIDSLTHGTFLQSHCDDSLETCLTHFGCDVDFDKSIEELTPYSILHL